MNFDPNKQNKPNYVWATYIPTRSPKFKTYSSRGPAINSLYNTHIFNRSGKTYVIPDEVKLYKFVDGLWVEVQFTRSYTWDEKIKVIE